MKTSIDQQYIESRIKDVTYHRLSDTTVTICSIEMVNGFSVQGESACVDPKNFDAAVGRKIAYENAFQKLWQLEGYMLAERVWKHTRGDENQYEAEQIAWFGKLRNELMDVLGTSDPRDILINVKQLVASHPTKAPLEFIAMLCHEVNRAYCYALGDFSQVGWQEAPEWQRVSARMGVDLHLMGEFGPEASHLSWMRQKVSEGWKYGALKDAEKKEHPCMVPFEDLPREQQAKDYIFRAIVHCFK